MTAWENQQSVQAKTKAQISFAVASRFVVTAKLISAIVFATRIVQFLYFLNPKFPASNHLMCLFSPVCVGPGQNPNCWFSYAQTQTVFLQQVFKYVRERQFNIFKSFDRPNETGIVLNVKVGPSDERTNARQLFIVSILSILNQCARGDKKICD